MIDADSNRPRRAHRRMMSTCIACHLSNGRRDLPTCTYRFEVSFCTRPTSSCDTNSPLNSISEMRYSSEFRQDEEHRHENNNEYYQEREEFLKEFLPHSSTSNGDIRSTSSLNKRHQRSRSRRMPSIVLIPQQSRPLSTLTASSSPSVITRSHSHYQLFNSNMYLLERHLKHLMEKQKHEEERNEIVNEWKLMALIMDRLLFWLFAFFTILSTVMCLIIIPFLKNAGYISALSKDFIKEYSSTESVSNFLDEQLRRNLTGEPTSDT